MSQFGMQMPGGGPRRATTLDSYAVLAFVACLCMFAACVAMFFAARKVGPEGNPLGIQKAGDIKIAGTGTP